MDNDYPYNWLQIARETKEAADWCCEICGEHHDVPPYILTVHHINYDKSDCRPDNMVALCQRCHLKVQGWKVQPRDRYDLLRKAKAEGKQLSLEV